MCSAWSDVCRVCLSQSARTQPLDARLRRLYQVLSGAQVPLECGWSKSWAACGLCRGELARASALADSAASTERMLTELHRHGVELSRGTVLSLGRSRATILSCTAIQCVSVAPAGSSEAPGATETPALPMETSAHTQQDTYIEAVLSADGDTEPEELSPCHSADDLSPRPCPKDVPEKDLGEASLWAHYPQIANNASSTLPEIQDDILINRQIEKYIDSNTHKDTLEPCHTELNYKDILETSNTEMNDKDTLETSRTEMNDKDTLETSHTEINDKDTLASSYTEMNDKDTIEKSHIQMNDEDSLENCHTEMNGTLTYSETHNRTENMNDIEDCTEQVTITIERITEDDEMVFDDLNADDHKDSEDSDDSEVHTSDFDTGMDSDHFIDKMAADDIKRRIKKKKHINESDTKITKNTSGGKKQTRNGRKKVNVNTESDIKEPVDDGGTIATFGEPRDEFMHACARCGRRFRTARQLSRHARLHRDRLLACDMCHRSYADAAQLEVHKEKHSGRYPLACRICGRRYKLHSILSVHMRTHTGELPYACTVCDRRFNMASNLRTHLRTHTGEQPYQCTRCEQAFNHNVSLKAHFARYHGETLPRPKNKVQLTGLRSSQIADIIAAATCTTADAAANKTRGRKPKKNRGELKDITEDIKTLLAGDEGRTQVANDTKDVETRDIRKTKKTIVVSKVKAINVKQINPGHATEMETGDNVYDMKGMKASRNIKVAGLRVTAGNSSRDNPEHRSEIGNNDLKLEHKMTVTVGKKRLSVDEMTVMHANKMTKIQGDTAKR